MLLHVGTESTNLFPRFRSFYLIKGLDILLRSTYSSMKKKASSFFMDGAWAKIASYTPATD